LLVAVAAAAGGVLWLGETALAQGDANRIPRAPDGRPDFSGTWQALNTANWDLQDHAARQGPVASLGASFGVPAGQGVVVGNEIPYRPEALARKKANGENWMTLDPEVKCYLPGVPRATYQGFPFQIVQTPHRVFMAYEFSNASRIVYMNSNVPAPIEFWMGWSQGRWDGETLVVDVTGFNADTWFDRAGNYHSEELHVVERYTAIDRDHLMYEATIEDPKIFTRPWTISMPLYRRIEKTARPLEYLCVPFVEEMMYGHLRKPGTR
jgi:hypothetical protein